MQRALMIALVLMAGGMLFGAGFLVGAREGMALIRQEAVDEGYAVRDPEFRWRSSDELTRRPARRTP